jgi:SulP family sulfate permease
MSLKFWRGDLSGGVAAAFAALPVELVYGLMAVAPLGAAYAEHGLRAAFWGCILAGVFGLVFRTAGGMITGTRPATGLLLGALASVLIESGDVQQLPDPAATVFLLLLLCTALAGLFQFMFGLVGVGRALKFVPYPVIAGLTCGVGILMAIFALKPMLGMPGGARWGDLLNVWHPLSFIVTLTTIIVCFKASSITKRIPNAVIALIAGSLMHHLLVAILGAESLGPTLGGTNGLIPSFSIWDCVNLNAVSLRFKPVASDTPLKNGSLWTGKRIFRAVSKNITLEKSSSDLKN